MAFLGLCISTFSIVFAMLDPFGTVPIFLTLTAEDSPERRNWTARRACFISFIVLTFFTLLGDYFLSFFGISLAALQIAGGLILLTIAFEMLRVNPVEEKISQKEENEASAKADVSIIPLAIPMLAGPASLATVLMLSAKARGTMEHLAIILSVAIALVLTYILLRYAFRVLNYVGQTGLNVLTRIMGFLLAAMAIQFVINGYIAIR